MEIDIKHLVTRAKKGNKDALEMLVKSIQDRIYRFSLKMLYHICDAEDATQEILIKIITKLDSFKAESSFSTWSFAIAANHLKNRQLNQKEKWYTFKRCEDAILGQIPDKKSLSYPKAEQDLIVEEMRISCMQALLQCLDRDHRLAYILGTSIGVKSPEGAEILGITPSAFRKRLSRARISMRTFLTRHCDLFDTKNLCNCKNQSVSAIKRGVIDPENLLFTGGSTAGQTVPEIRQALNSLDLAAREIAMMRIHQQYQAPGDFTDGIKQIIENRLN